MTGRIEWKSRESDEVEHAIVTRCVYVNGFYNVAFSNTELLSEGRISIGSDDQGEQNIKGMYMFTDGSYKGEADVTGTVSAHGGTVTFTGMWHDSEDETGEWDVYIEFEAPSEYMFTYDVREQTQ
jgi:hypothetical protein